MNSHAPGNETPEEDFNLVAMWLRKDPCRWAAGALAGIFAGLIMLAFAGLLTSAGGGDFWYAAKAGALPFLGGPATEYGMHTGAIIVGVVAIEALAALLGVLYSHFVGTNSFAALLPMGLVWGIFSWIFIFNLYSQAWRDVHAAEIPSGPAFFVLLVFGISLTSVAFFDRALRGKQATALRAA